MFVNKVPMQNYKKARSRKYTTNKKSFGDLGWSTGSISRAVSNAVSSVTQVAQAVVKPVTSIVTSATSAAGAIVKGVANPVGAVITDVGKAVSFVPIVGSSIAQVGRTIGTAGNVAGSVIQGAGQVTSSVIKTVATNPLKAIPVFMPLTIAQSVLPLLAPKATAVESQTVLSPGQSFKDQITSMGGKNIIVNNDGSADWTDASGNLIHTDTNGNSTLVSAAPSSSFASQIAAQGGTNIVTNSDGSVNWTNAQGQALITDANGNTTYVSTAQQVANSLTPVAVNSTFMSQIQAAGGSNIRTNTDGSIDWINSQGVNVHTDVNGNSTTSGQPVGGGSIADQVASSLTPGETQAASASIVDQLISIGAKNITKNSDGSVSWTDSTGQSVITDANGNSAYVAAEQTIAQQVLALGAKNIKSNSDGSVDWTDSTGKSVHTDVNGNSTYKAVSSFWERIKAALRGGQSLGSILDDLQAAEQSLSTIVTQGASMEQTIRGGIKTGQAYVQAGKGILNAVQSKKSTPTTPAKTIVASTPGTIFGLPSFVVYGGAVVGVGGLGLLLWKMKNKEKSSGE